MRTSTARGPVLEDVLDDLVCPRGEPRLWLDGGGLVCAAGHRFDVARQGYVNLLDGPAPAAADTAAMVAARARVLDAGHLGAITDALVAAVATAAGPRLDGTGGDGMVVDLGAGTGHHLAAVLEATASPAGLAIDLSKHAARRAARAHPRIGAVVADVWRPLPVRDGAAAVVLDVFSPRNVDELGRLLRPRGVLVVVTPEPGHLDPLPRDLGLLGVGTDKTARLDRDLAEVAELTDRRTVHDRRLLDVGTLRDLALMGPSAHHLDPDDLTARLAELGGPVEVHVAVTLSSYRRR